MDTCPSLSACLNLLGTVVPAEDNGEGSNSEKLAALLARFGEPAKQELLKRAVGPHAGWRNVAGAVLSDWPSWSTVDVPKLREALQTQPGSWVARPLGRIGTIEAIEALVEDLPKSDSGNQTDFALAQLGDKAVPYLLPLFDNEKTARLATGVLASMKPLPTSFVPSWVRLATDPHEPTKRRIAALRAIASIGYKTETQSTDLKYLIRDPDLSIRNQAVSTLKALRDPTVAVDVARSCHPKAERFDSLALDSLLCLRDVATFGDAARGGGEQLLQFLHSESNTERAYGITVLGVIGYSQAIPEIQAELDSGDWRIVYAAIRSLGWLGATGAAPSIEKIASKHWLPEVRQEAAVVAAALRSTRSLERPTKDQLLSTNTENRYDPFGQILEFVREGKRCTTNQWEWNGHRFAFSKEAFQRSSTLRFRDGSLVGTDHGEWGGELAWLPGDGQPTVLMRDNIRTLMYAKEGALAISGLGHLGIRYGYAVKVSKTDGAWTLSETARFPAEPDQSTRLGEDLFAVRSSGRVFVFTSKGGIQGEASCP